MTMRRHIDCAICGKPCKWVATNTDEGEPSEFGGWYCERCDAYSESDVEVED